VKAKLQDMRNCDTDRCVARGGDCSNLADSQTRLLVKKLKDDRLLKENMQRNLLVMLSQSGTRHRDNIHWQGPYPWFAISKTDPRTNPSSRRTNAVLKSRDNIHWRKLIRQSCTELESAHRKQKVDKKDQRSKKKTKSLAVSKRYKDQRQHSLASPIL